ncbi:MAG: LysE family translocator [Deinococcota bacterium]
MISLEFLIASLILVLMPGTGAIYTLSTALAHGFRASVVAAFGCTVSIVPHMLVSILGLSAIVQASAQVFQGLKVVGALYLLYLAWGMWRETNILRLEDIDTPQDDERSQKLHPQFKQIAGKAILMNVLNPQLILFFMAFLPLSIQPDAASPTLHMAVLGLVFMVMTFVVYVGYGLLAQGLRLRLAASPRILGWVQRVFAIVFVVLGSRLALAAPLS